MITFHETEKPLVFLDYIITYYAFGFTRPPSRERFRNSVEISHVQELYMEVRNRESIATFMLNVNTLRRRSIIG